MEETLNKRVIPSSLNGFSAARNQPIIPISKSYSLNAASSNLIYDSFEINSINQNLERTLHRRSPVMRRYKKDFTYKNEVSNETENGHFSRVELPNHRYPQSNEGPVQEYHQPDGPIASPIQLQERKPIWKLSPRNGGSTLYDSYELKAVARQLNRALQTTETNALSPYIGYLRSPFYPFGRRYLDHLYKENAKTPKRIACGRVVWGGLEVKTGNKSSRGLLPRLWRKIKKTVFRKSHEK